MEFGSTDEVIALEVSADHIDKFEILLDRYEVELYRFVNNLMHNEQATEEILTVVFARFFADLADNNLPEVVKIKLYQLALLTISDLSNSLRPYLAEQSAEQLELIFKEAHQTEAEQIVELESFVEIVTSYLMRLPFEYRVTQVLTDMQGFSLEEAAHVLNVPLIEVEQRYSRGRSLLRRWVANDGFIGLVEAFQCEQSNQGFCLTRN